MATQMEANLFEEQVLAPVGNATGHFRAKLAGFLAMEGNLYRENHALMVVGRAVNGFRCGAYPQELADQPFRNRFAESVLNSVNKYQGQCPMTWVTNHWGTGNRYNTKRSAFWRVIRRVTDQLQVADRHLRDWPSHLVWSNLYKLSPWRGKNPSRKLRYVQLAGCQALFQLEIGIYRPKRLLLLTGRHWAVPFLDALGAKELSGANRYVRCAGQLQLPDAGQTRFVVACRPEGKPERLWTEDVLQAFQRRENAAP